MKNIFKKYKQLLIGITIGSLITAFPVGAAVQEYILYKSECTLVNSDGTKYEDKDYPVLMYKGSNYVPIGKIAQFLGVEFTWEGTTKTATFKKPIAMNTTKSLNEGGEKMSTEATKTPLPDLTVPEISSENNPNNITILMEEDNFEKTTFKNIKAIIYKSNTYVSLVDIGMTRTVGKNNSIKVYKDDKLILETENADFNSYIVYKGYPYINIDLVNNYLE